MSEIKTYTLIQEPRGDAYWGLLLVSLRYASHALLVVRNFDHQLVTHQIFSRLRPFIESETHETSWPGTELQGGDSAVVVKFKFNDASVQILSNAVKGLYDWISPDRPEDLCLLRPSGVPLLATIAHEKDSFLQVSDNELRTILAGVPSLVVMED